MFFFLKKHNFLIYGNAPYSLEREICSLTTFAFELSTGVSVVCLLVSKKET